MKFTPCPAPWSSLRSVEQSRKRWSNSAPRHHAELSLVGGASRAGRGEAPCSAGSDFFSPGFRSVPNFNLWYLALEEQVINDDRHREIDRASPHLRGPRSQGLPQSSPRPLKTSRPLAPDPPPLGSRPGGRGTTHSFMQNPLFEVRQSGVRPQLWESQKKSSPSGSFTCPHEGTGRGQ